MKHLDVSRYFYNAINFENSTYLGTDQGVYKLEGKELVLYNKTIIGPIAIKNKKIGEGIVRVTQLFKSLLPDEYKNTPINALVLEDTLLLVVKGKLFMFEKNSFESKSIGSVRAISKNYIGTYSGVTRKNDSVKILKYTNSYIREFKNATFICWDGLYIKRDSITKNYYSTIYPGVKLGDSLLGKAKDIVEINHPNYLLVTDIGMYHLNIDNEKVSLISNKFSDVNFVNWLDPPTADPQNKLGLTLFTHQSSIYGLDKKSFEIIELHKFKSKINGIFIIGAEEFYVLLEDSLIVFNPATNQRRVLVEDLRLVNDVGGFENLIFITSDLGLHLYDKNSDIVVKNIISDELNKKAFYITKDSLYLGGVNGLYSFDYPSLVHLFLKKINPNDSEKFSPIGLIKKYLWQIVAVLGSLLFLSNLVFYRKYKSALKIKLSHSQDIRLEIENYIEKNINSVNIKRLKSEFNLSNNQLYKYMGSVNPGEVIRNKRSSLVKRLRRSNVSEEEISKQTGFSISYLKKI